MPHKDYTLIRHLGALSATEGDQIKMVSYVQWRYHDISLDIRKWEGSEPKRGISLRGDEIRLLCLVLKHEYPEYFT